METSIHKVVIEVGNTIYGVEHGVENLQPGVEKW